MADIALPTGLPTTPTQTGASVTTEFVIGAAIFVGLFGLLAYGLSRGEAPVSYAPAPAPQPAPAPAPAPARPSGRVRVVETTVRRRRR